MPVNFRSVYVPVHRFFFSIRALYDYSVLLYYWTLSYSNERVNNGNDDDDDDDEIYILV